MTQLPSPSTDRLADRTFFVGVLLKGAGGLVELVFGLALVFLSVATLQHLTHPLDRFGLHLASGITAKTRAFTIFYAITRGIIRGGLAVGLLREKLWAYPLAIIFLVGTMLLQLWLILHHFNWALLGLTIFDMFILVLTWYEYRKLRRGGHLHLDFL